MGVHRDAHRMGRAAIAQGEFIGGTDLHALRLCRAAKPRCAPTRRQVQP